MSRPLGYPTDPWGRRFAHLEAPIPVRATGRLRPKSLREALPDDPDYRKYIPIEYRLDAKRVVGDFAQDLQRGRSAHVWVELAHAGLLTAEIFAETSALIGGLAIAGPALALVGNFLALGAPYQAAAEAIAKESSASGYSRGAVIGADGRSAHLVREYYGNLVFRNSFFPDGAKVAKANHHAGLVAGYLQGRVLTKNQRAIFWRDLGSRMGDQSYRGPASQWRSRDWNDWYTYAAARFRHDHLVG